MIATLAWIPLSNQTASSIYCYPGDPPDVYQACLAYNQGINQQVTNQRQLQNIQGQIRDVQAQINSLYALIKSINAQISAQNALIAQTNAKIALLDRQVRFKVGDVTRLQADVAVRDQLLDQRLRFVDAHGPINYVELVLTAASFNDLMNRMLAAQQIATSDRKLLDQLGTAHQLLSANQADLANQRSQVAALLLQQQAVEADLERNNRPNKSKDAASREDFGAPAHPTELGVTRIRWAVPADTCTSFRHLRIFPEDTRPA